MNNFKSNDLIEAVLYNNKNISSYIKYRKLLRKIKRISPDYSTLEVIYDFIDQLNYAYFYCLTDENHLFIGDSRNKKEKEKTKSLIYKDNSVTIMIILKPNDTITLDINRYMGYKHTTITFKNGDAGKYIDNKLQEQLFINSTNLIMDELYKNIKKYRKFRSIK